MLKQFIEEGVLPGGPGKPRLQKKYFHYIQGGVTGYEKE
jgi:hypothetical protein